MGMMGMSICLDKNIASDFAYRIHAFISEIDYRNYTLSMIIIFYIERERE